MPLQEIVFRTLLLADDQTMTLGEIHSELSERWSSPIRPITVTVAGLSRILDNDVFYGFELIPPPEPEALEPDLPMLSAAETDLATATADDADLIDSDAEDEEDLDEDDPYEEDDEDGDED